MHALTAFTAPSNTMWSPRHNIALDFLLPFCVAALRGISAAMRSPLAHIAATQVNFEPGEAVHYRHLRARCIFPVALDLLADS